MTVQNVALLGILAAHDLTTRMNEADTPREEERARRTAESALERAMRMEADKSQIPMSPEAVASMRNRGPSVKKTRPKPEESGKWEFKKGPTPIERARLYLDRREIAIQGQDGGTACFRAAQDLVVGFCLDEDTALHLLETIYNPKCLPKFSRRELVFKVRSAAKSRLEPGYLLNAPRRST